MTEGNEHCTCSNICKDYGGVCKREERRSEVIKLKTRNGSEVYLIGTDDGKAESVEKVVRNMKQIKPNIVVVQLDVLREYLMTWKKEDILTEGERFRSRKMKCLYNDKGIFHAMTYLFLIRSTTHKIKDTDRIPGGQYRAAFFQAHYNNVDCTVYLGDRPVDITLNRTMNALWPWQCVYVACKTFFENSVNKFREYKNEVQVEDSPSERKDMADALLSQAAVIYPNIVTTFISERDMYCTYSLQHAADSKEGSKVLGIVDMSSVPFIEQHWGNISEDHIKTTLSLPQRSLGGKFVTGVTSLVCLSAYGVNRTFEKLLGYVHSARTAIGGKTSDDSEM